MFYLWYLLHIHSTLVLSVVFVAYSFHFCSISGIFGIFVPLLFYLWYLWHIRSTLVLSVVSLAYSFHYCSICGICGIFVLLLFYLWYPWNISWKIVFLCWQWIMLQYYLALYIYTNQKFFFNLSSLEFYIFARGAFINHKIMICTGFLTQKIIEI